MKYRDGSRVGAEGANGKERVRRIPFSGLQRASDAARRLFCLAPEGLRRFWRWPALLAWPRSLRISARARALASAKIEQQRDSFQYFNSLLRADRSVMRPMFGPHAPLPRSPSLVSRITATKFIPRLTASWNGRRGDSSTRWRAMQLRRLIYLRLRRFIRHRCEPDWHFFGRSRSIWAYRWNALSSTRWEMTAALPPYICAPCDLSAIVFGEADPPTAHIWSARRGETILLKTRNSRVASRVPGYFF